MQEIAGTVSAFDEAALREIGVEQIADAVSIIPNVQIKGARLGPAISIRGISQSFTSASPVAFHVNGVFGLSDLGAYYDAQGLEVIRGPSGTLYGRNATGGAVNVEWNRPHSSWELLGDVTLGNYDRYQVRGVANVPFLGEGDERLMGRFVVQREVEDGWVDNLLAPRSKDPDGADDTLLRGSIRSLPREDISIDLRGWWSEREYGTSPAKVVYDDYRTGFIDLTDPVTGATLGTHISDPYQGFEQLVQSLIADPASLSAAVSGALLFTCQMGLPGCSDPGISTLAEATRHWLNNGFALLGVPAILLRGPGVFEPALPNPSNPRELRSRASRIPRASSATGALGASSSGSSRTSRCSGTGA